MITAAQKKRMFYTNTKHQILTPVGMRIKMKQQYVARDQYGRLFTDLSHPRKDLLRFMHRQHAQKMYAGNGQHVGYVIGGRWFIVYALTRIDQQETSK